MFAISSVELSDVSTFNVFGFCIFRELFCELFEFFLPVDVSLFETLDENSLLDLFYQTQLFYEHVVIRLLINY